MVRLYHVFRVLDITAFYYYGPFNDIRKKTTPCVDWNFEKRNKTA